MFVIIGSVIAVDDQHAEVLRSESAVNPDSFQYNYETSNGIVAKEAGQLKTIGTESAIVSQGEYGYKADDGVEYSVSYVADENGYQPTGKHLPVAPPVPEQIARALEWIAAHPPVDGVKKF